MKKILYILLSVILLSGVLSSCSKDRLDPTLAQEKAVEGSINTVDDVYGLLYGAFDRMTSTNYYGRNFIIYGEVRADNCFSNGNSGRFVSDAEMDYLDTFGGYWATAYQVIASANIIIALDPASITGDAATLAHIQGQAYAIRAMVHFDLIRYYGQQHTSAAPGLGVPYITVYKGDDFTPVRNTVAECQAFIEADIATAITMMNPANDGSTENFSHWTAQALKSRVAIYYGDWAAAETASLAVMGSTFAIVPEADFVSYWTTDGGVNSIMELAYTGTDNNNINGLQQIYRGAAYGDVEGLQDLYDAFDVGDVRASAAMIGLDPDPDLPSPKPYTNLGKYPSASYNDNIALFRYEEVLLNYAEALFRQNGGADVTALATLNDIAAERNAAVLVGPVTEDMILLERRKELCFEGFRFHDLARTGRDIPEPYPLQQSHGGPTYGSDNYAFPIPLSEMEANSNMVQNPGYSQ